MGADGLVHRTTHHVKRPNTNKRLVLGITHPPWPSVQGKVNRKGVHEQRQGQTSALNFRHDRQMIHRMGLQIGHRAPQGIGGHHNVRIRKQQNLTSCGFRTFKQGMILPQPSGGQRGNMLHPQLGMLLRQLVQNFPRAIFRSIVKHHKLIVRIIQRQHRTQRFFQMALLVTRGNDHRNGWPGSICGRQWHFCQPGNRPISPNKFGGNTDVTQQCDHSQHCRNCQNDRNGRNGR